MYSGMGVNLQDYIDEDLFHTVDTYHTPLIVSAGADEQMGLHEPWHISEDTNGNGVLDLGEDINSNGQIDRISGFLAQPIGVVLPAVPVYPLTGEEAMLDNVSNRNRRAGGQL